ncbi:MAG: hypothetical protein LKF75_05085 [Bacilli bacterium]|jgi:hypothetical protein|nr:hypothetical protein [Bacilli bacterium]MCH4229045.1 hypothetical protein [Bacilli bacterium]MCH4277940.1 hypothetical protein [Bacilli bacterium]
MQIKSFSVKNFKNFQNRVSFDFSKTRDYGFNSALIKNGLVNKALVYGYNDSGKTNLGLAMMDITSHLGCGSSILSHDTYYLNAYSADECAEFTYVFLDNGQKEIIYSYKVGEDMRLQTEEVQVDGKLFFQFNHRTGKYINNFIEAKDIAITQKSKDESALKFMKEAIPNLSKDSPINEIVDFADAMVFSSSIRNRNDFDDGMHIEDIVSFIIENDCVKDFESFLDKCDIHYDLLAIEASFGRSIGSIHDGKTADFLGMASSGIYSLLVLYYRLKNKEKPLKLLYLDDFDSFYNFKLAKHVLAYINSDHSFQSVLTSNNSYLADNAFMRPDCYFLIKNGTIKSFADRTDKTIREGNSLEHLLISGAFE